MRFTAIIAMCFAMLMTANAFYISSRALGKMAIPALMAGGLYSSVGAGFLLGQKSGHHGHLDLHGLHLDGHHGHHGHAIHVYPVEHHVPVVSHSVITTSHSHLDLHHGHHF